MIELVEPAGADLTPVAAPTPSAPGAAYRIAKRTIDLVICSAALIVSAPLFGVLALLVWMDGEGSPLFRQARVGAGGRPFHLLKFRSMHANADACVRADADLYALFVVNGFKLPAEIDPRITRIGRWLRKTSLDELPQLVNILRGDMSLVGPRPVVPDELALFGEHAAAYRSVRPGLTGIWQVSGRCRVKYPERARLEAGYVNTCTLAGDLWIILRTVPAVLKGRGAE